MDASKIFKIYREAAWKIEGDLFFPTVEEQIFQFPDNSVVSSGCKQVATDYLTRI